MDKEKKTAVIGEYKTHERDTGSTDVQIALLTQRIEELTGHMRLNRHDFHTQRGLLTLVGHRRKLLSYLERESRTRHRALLDKLGIRG